MIERPAFRVALLLLWASLLTYAFTLAPPEDEALTRALLRGTFGGRFEGVDPAVAAVFSALGAIPVLMASLLVPDGRGRRPPAWPFSLLSFGLGAYALIPYLVLRRPGGSPDSTRLVRVVRLLRSRGLSWLVVVTLLGLLAWGAVAGSAAAYLHAFHTARLVHVMTIDLGLCASLLPILIAHVRRVEKIEGESAALRWLVVVPVLGPALWNALVRRSDREA